MKSLDAFTVVFMTAFVCVGMSIVMFSVQRSFRAEVRGLSHWAWAQLAMVLAAILMCLRGIAPDWVTVPFSNAALLWSIGLSVVATRLFYARRPGWRSFHLIWIGSIAGLSWFLLVQPNFAARVVIFSTAELAFHLIQLYLIARFGERQFSSYFFAALILVQTGLVSVRCIAAMSHGGSSVDLQKATALATGYLAISDFVAILLSVAFIVLAARRVQHVLEHRATVDPLTGVLNRRGFEALCERMRVRARALDRPLSLLAIDIDHFKSVNDRFGHAIGDQILVQVAAAIRSTLRERDALARLGGEEFVVLLDESSARFARDIGERIQQALQDQVGGLPTCTVSIGIAIQSSKDEPIEIVLARADNALYRAKDAGRNCMVLAEDREGVPVPA